MKFYRYLIVAGFGLAGCFTKSGSDKTTDEHAGQTGMRLGVAVNKGPGEDVATIEIKIDRVACFAGETFDAVSVDQRVALADASIPSGFQGAPLDPNAKHPFADIFELLPVGCYNVSVAPLMANGNASSQCAVGIAQNVEVVDQEVTEVMLLSQCKSAMSGGLDTTIAFNRPPSLTSFSYTPGKFVTAGTTVKVCASASDPDGDQIQFEWSRLESQNEPAINVITSNVDNNGVLTECANIVTKDLGKLMYQVKVFDMILDESGKLVRIEDWLTLHGFPNQSHGGLRFPIFVSAASGQPGNGNGNGNGNQPGNGNNNGG